MSKKRSTREKVMGLQAYGKGSLQFISGKWFFKGKEVNNIRQFMAHSICDIEGSQQLTDCINLFIDLYGTSGYWPDTEIIQAGKERLREGKLEPLCYPLKDKQLKIINRLIDGKDDEKMFICTGVGGSGKSTFLNIVKQIFDNDVASCPLSELSGYNLAEAVKHRLIASDELSADDIDNKSIKTIISRQRIQVNPKFQPPYEVQTQSAIFYCCNNPPKIDIDDSGMLRRIVYYAMNTPISNPDTSLNKRNYTFDELSNIVAHALAMDMTDWQKDFEKETIRYLTKNNSVYIYNEYESYLGYATACKENGLKAFSKPRWEEIRRLMQSWGII